MTIDERPYCDYCETYGHTFRSCPKRDDDSIEDEFDALAYEGGATFQEAFGRTDDGYEDPRGLA